MGKSKSNKKSPARKRYEERNPVESFRAPKERHELARKVKEKYGLSNGDIFDIGLARIELKMRAEEEVRQEAYDKGWEDGVNKAVALYALNYPCSICKEMIEVTTEEEKRAIRKFMIDEGWGHAACHDR